MTWSVQFYNERLNLTARYQVEAAGPSAAVAVAGRALVAAYPPEPRRRKHSLFQRAQASDADESGWVLYRIGGIPHHPHATGADIGR
jgi:hypothetical protein